MIKDDNKSKILNIFLEMNKLKQQGLKSIKYLDLLKDRERDLDLLDERE